MQSEGPAHFPATPLKLGLCGAMPLVRLPRASSRAYRALKPTEGEAQDEQQQQPQAPADAQAPQTPAANPQLVAALTELKARDGAGVLEAAGGGDAPPLRCAACRCLPPRLPLALLSAFACVLLVTRLMMPGC